MMIIRTRIFIPLLALALAGPAAAQVVGSVGAVNPSAQGTPPGGASRSLSVGLSVANRERIQTSGEGTAQIVINDSSTMMVGRNSAVTIDRFVYDASRATGEQALTMSKGVLRFVGGNISHGGGMSIKTSVATVGLRGGVGTLAFGGDCGFLAFSQFGQLTVKNNVSSVTISRPGFGVCVASANSQIPEPFLVPADLIAQLMGLLGSQPGQTGGLQHPPHHRHVRHQRSPVFPGPPEGTPGLNSIDAANSGNGVVGNGNQNFPRGCGPSITFAC